MATTLEKTMPTPRVLCVDDDRNILEAMRRSLKGDFELVIAVGGVEGLQKLREEGPFAVVISDLRMPVVDGLTLLRELSQIDPDTVGILLTGNADVNAAVSAINEGQLFRFLTKPCPVKYLHATISAGIEQYKLVTTEKVILRETLFTSMRALSELACLQRPDVATRVQRARRLATGLSEHACPQQTWACEIGMLLLVTGWVTLPEAVMARASQPGALMPSDLAQLARLPALASRLIADVPRLELVRDSLEQLQHPRSDDEAPVIQVLRILWDYDRESSADDAIALEALRGHGHREELRTRLHGLLVADEHSGPTIEVRIGDLQPGMILTENVFDEKGSLLIGRGTEVGPGLSERIRNYWSEESRERSTSVRAPQQSVRAAA